MPVVSEIGDSPDLLLNSVVFRGGLPIRNWRPCLHRFMIDFGSRLADYQ